MVSHGQKIADANPPERGERGDLLLSVFIGVCCPRQIGLMLVRYISSRNAHQKFSEILPAQQADECPWRVLESLNHVFAIFDLSLADPGGDIAA